MAGAGGVVIPTMVAAMETLENLNATAGAAPLIKTYLAAKGIASTPTLATVARVQHKAAAGSEDVAAKAVLVHLFTDAERQWKAASHHHLRRPPAQALRAVVGAGPGLRGEDRGRRQRHTEKLLGAEDVLAQLSGAKALKLIDGNLVTEDTDEWTP